MRTIYEKYKYTIINSLLLFGVILDALNYKAGTVFGCICMFWYLFLPCSSSIVNNNKYLWWFRQTYFFVVGLGLLYFSVKSYLDI